MVKKIFSYLILPIIIIGLVYLIVESIMEPIRFNEQKEAREEVAIQRLKDIRTLQVAFMSEKGHYAATVDSLKSFYNNEDMVVTLSIGSPDDSAAVAHTEELRKANRRITNEQLYERYLAGDRNLVFSSNQDFLISIRTGAAPSRNRSSVTSSCPRRIL